MIEIEIKWNNAFIGSIFLFHNFIRKQNNFVVNILSLGSTGPVFVFEKILHELCEQQVLEYKNIILFITIIFIILLNSEHDGFIF